MRRQVRMVKVLLSSVIDWDLDRLLDEFDEVGWPQDPPVENVDFRLAYIENGGDTLVFEVTADVDDEDEGDD